MVTASGKKALLYMASGRKPKNPPAVLNIPVGGTGAAAGCWDNATNRNNAIASINAALTQLRALGLIS